MARELFIYWHTGADEAAAAVEAATRLQRELRLQHPGLQARLYRRADDKPGCATLMEVYARPPLGVDAALEAAISAAAAALGAHGDGARHVEAFDSAGG